MRRCVIATRGNALRSNGRAAALRQAHRQPRRAGPAVVDLRLDLDQHRPRAFQCDEHHAAGHRLGVLAQEDRTRLGHALQAALGHREDADFVDGAEAPACSEVVGRATKFKDFNNCV